MRIQLKVISEILFLLSVFNFANSFAYQTENDSINKIVFQGAIGSGFGHQVCNGDFNGDEISDLVITSVFQNTNAPLKISIFYGGSDINTTADLIIISDTVYAGYYEYSIANAGDVNGDGFDDLIVGFFQSMNYTGRAFLYSGGNPMDANYDLLFNGIKPFSGFGNAVNSAGDMNGDGFDDILISASIDAYFQTDTSKVFLYFGSSDVDTIPDLIFVSPYTDDYFGNSMALAGDINDDGYDDILIGYQRSSDKVYLFLGSQTVDDSVDFVLQNNQPNSNFGFSMCGTHDFNNDGFIDIVIGAPKFDFSGGGAERFGRVYVYLGSQSFDIIPDLMLTGAEVFGQFGYSISSAGFFDEDIYLDLIISAPFSNMNYGRAFVYYGSSILDDSPDILIDGDYTDLFRFGGTITNCDLDNNGLDEVLISTRQLDFTKSQNVLNLDQVYLYSYVYSPHHKIQYEAKNFILEGSNSFTFDVEIKNVGQSIWQFNHGSVAFTFNQSILRNGSLIWTVVPGFSDLPIQQQPNSTVIYNSYTIGTTETLTFEGDSLYPDSELRYSRFRIQTTDSCFAGAPLYLRFAKNGTIKTNSSWWFYHSISGWNFLDEDKSYIELSDIFLPVELTLFIATLNQTKVQLNWQTATEINNQGFEIQRKLENSDWIRIGFRQGQGTTTEPTTYFYEDDISEMNTSKLYYRLKQIDFNGSFTYSEEVEVITHPLAYSISQNYPNPFNLNTIIKFEIPKTANVKIEIFDILGRIIRTLVDEEKPAGRYEFEFDGSSLSSGVYYFSIQSSDFIKTRKMLLLK